MRVIKKILKVILIIFITLVLLIAAADAAWIYVPQIKAQAEINGLADVAQTLENITVPESAQVVALGEASHGNAEFQALKLNVLKQLVETDGVRAFALEADFGEGMEINDYIHSQNDTATAEEAVQKLAFNIYHTDETAQLIRWMRDYNAKAADNEQLYFFGFDMQNPKTGLARLLSFCNENAVLPGFDMSPLQSYIDGSYGIVSEQGQAALDCIYAAEKELLANKEEYLKQSDEVLFMLQITACVRNFVSCQDNGGAENYIAYNNARDKAMAENVLWISDYMQGVGAKTLIAGHNGHVAYTQQFYTPMGSNLKDALGSKYFVIGTDYYKTTCNINVAGPDATRGDYKFCSADIFAANAKRQGGSYYLDFQKALAQNGEAAALLNTEIYTGSLGEGYTWAMHFMPTSHRIKAKPLDLYDAMVFIYETTPIRVV